MWMNKSRVFNSHKRIREIAFDGDICTFLRPQLTPSSSLSFTTGSYVLSNFSHLEVMILQFTTRLRGDENTGEACCLDLEPFSPALRRSLYGKRVRPVLRGFDSCRQPLKNSLQSRQTFIALTQILPGRN